MKISLNWLQDFININLAPEKLAAQLSKKSTEIKEILKQEEKYKNIIVGKILEIKDHPDAEKLKIAKIDIGKKKLNIVCGAKNIKVGQHVPIALIGSITPNTWKTKNEFKITKAKIRGVESEGMMCSERELDLGDNHTGIYILENKTTVGNPISKELNLDDVIFEADFLTNQGYAMSHLGLAKEISAITKEPLKPIHSEISLPNAENDNELKVIIENEKLCPRYTGIIMENIEIGPSPEWMQRRLRAAGMRAVNNVVDTTNYVMLELGQPMHAFDYDKISKKDGVAEIIVRISEKGEKIVTLDEKEQELPAGILLISDREKPVAIAGIIGGANTEIDEKTKKIVLESANFDAITLRKGARKLAARTDAVARFEKVLDPNLTMTALKRAVELLLEITKGKTASKVIDNYPAPLKSWVISLPYEKTNKLLGINIPKEKQLEILNSLGFTTEEQEANLIVTVPTSRRDVKRTVDLIEEIIRIYGYDNIPLAYPLVEQKAVKLNKKVEFIKNLKNLILGKGFFEIQTYSMTGERILKICNIKLEDHIKIINPQAPEREYMRKSLLPEVLEALAKNLKIEKKAGLFEIQKTYWKNYEYDPKDKLDTYAKEDEKFTLLWSEEGLNYYDIKGVAESIFTYLKIDKIEYAKNNENLLTSKVFHPTKSAIIKKGSKIIGILGEINPQVLKNLDIQQIVTAFELDIKTLLSIIPKTKTFQPYPKYQITSQDISILVDKSVKVERIYQIITNSKASKILKTVTAIDQYTGKGIPENKKSITINITLQAEDHTLAQEEIENARNTIIRDLEKKLKAELR